MREAIIAFRQRLNDWRHERRIQKLYVAFTNTYYHQFSLPQKLAAWDAYCVAVSQRSPKQIERMERAKGLRA